VDNVEGNYINTYGLSNDSRTAVHELLEPEISFMKYIFLSNFYVAAYLNFANNSIVIIMLFILQQQHLLTLNNREKLEKSLAVKKHLKSRSTILHKI
jgi:hypothetical protein